MQSDGSDRWKILCLGVFLSATYAINLYQIPPLLGTLQLLYSMNYTQAGLLMSAFSGSGIIMSLLWGILITKYGAKRVGGLALLICIFGNCIVTLSVNFPVLFLGRLVLGCGSHALPVLGAAMVAQWFKAYEIGFALGIYTMAFPLGTIFSLNVFGVINTVIGWQMPIILNLGIVSILLVLFAKFYRPILGDQRTQIIGMKKLFSIFTIIIPTGLIWMFYQAASSSYSTFALSYFIELGYSPIIASLFTSSWMFGSLIISPIFGRILDRYQKISLFVIIAGLVNSLLLISLPLSTPFEYLIIIAFMISTPLIPLCVFILVPRRLEVEKVNLGFSLQVIFANTGRTLGPILTGISLDATSLYPLAFQVMATFMIIPVLSGIYLTVSKNGHKTQ